VTTTQSAGPISCLEHRATRVLHCAIVTRAAVLMFPLLLQTIISNQMRPRRLRGTLGNIITLQAHGTQRHTRQSASDIKTHGKAPHATAMLTITARCLNCTGRTLYAFSAYMYKM